MQQPILAIDGATQPGYAVYNPNRPDKPWGTSPHWSGRLGLFCSHRKPTVVVEGQYARASTSRQSLITLSFTAGFQAGVAASLVNPEAPSVFVATPQQWRRVFDPEWGTLKKSVVHNRIWAKYAPHLPDRRKLSDDECDAAAMALSYTIKPAAFRVFKIKVGK